MINVHSGLSVDALLGLLHIMPLILSSRHTMGLLRSVCACVRVCVCVYQELRKAVRLAQIYHFCGGVSPRHHNDSLVQQKPQAL